MRDNKEVLALADTAGVRGANIDSLVHMGPPGPAQSAFLPMTRGHRFPAFGVLAGVVLFFAPASYGKGSGSKPQDPPGTTRDSHGQLRSNKTGQYADDPRVEADDGPDALRKKFSKLLACAPGWDAHHIIPLSLRTIPAVADAIKGGWDVNGRGNGVCLLEEIHGNGHRKYTDEVRAELGSPALNKLARSAKAKAVEQVVERLRKSLRSRNRPLE